MSQVLFEMFRISHFSFLISHFSLYITYDPWFFPPLLLLCCLELFLPPLLLLHCFCSSMFHSLFLDLLVFPPSPPPSLFKQEETEEQCVTAFPLALRPPTRAEFL
jgi:hypothetical protein